MEGERQSLVPFLTLIGYPESPRPLSPGKAGGQASATAARPGQQRGSM